MTPQLQTAVVALVNGLGALLLSFNIVLTTDQLAAIGVFVNSVLLVAALLLHQRTKKA